MNLLSKLPGLSWGGTISFVLKILPIILVVGAFAYAFLVVIPENKTLKDEVKRQAEAQLRLQQDFDTYKVNVDMLQAGIGAQSNVRIQQETIRERYRDVPVEVTEKPFADDGMRARADIVRNHQSSSPVFAPNDSGS